ncbi:MAG: hypothetical protein KR126chlam6_00083 [Candidatus Anoxychlamydiales bacterium]|nr:hypothetical protein [Candidatus Anoxychlamydiales bacterium]
MPSVPGLQAAKSYFEKWRTKAGHEEAADQSKALATVGPKPLSDKQLDALLKVLNDSEEFAGRAISRENITVLDDGSVKFRGPTSVVRGILQLDTDDIAPEEIKGIPPARVALPGMAEQAKAEKEAKVAEKEVEVPVEGKAKEEKKEEKFTVKVEIAAKKLLNKAKTKAKAAEPKVEAKKEEPKPEEVAKEAEKPAAAVAPEEVAKEAEKPAAEVTPKEGEPKPETAEKPKARWYTIIAGSFKGYLTNHTQMVLNHPWQAIIYSVAIKAFCLLIAPAFKMVAYITIVASCIIFDSVIVLHPSQFAKSLWKSTTDAFWRAVGSVFTKKATTETKTA